MTEHCPSVGAELPTDEHGFIIPGMVPQKCVECLMAVRYGKSAQRMMRIRAQTTTAALEQIGLKSEHKPDRGTRTAKVTHTFRKDSEEPLTIDFDCPRIVD